MHFPQLDKLSEKKRFFQNILMNNLWDKMTNFKILISPKNFLVKKKWKILNVVHRPLPLVYRNLPPRLTPVATRQSWICKRRPRRSVSEKSPCPNRPRPRLSHQGGSPSPPRCRLQLCWWRLAEVCLFVLVSSANSLQTSLPCYISLAYLSLLNEVDSYRETSSCYLIWPNQWGSLTELYITLWDQYWWRHCC